MHSPTRHALLAGLALAAPGAAVADDIRVAASIKPVHSLVAAVMAGVGEPHLIVRGAASPHSYSLRPSDAEALQQAAVVFWVGAGLETFLADAIATLAPQAQAIALADEDGLVLLPVREGGTWDEHADEDHDEHGEEDADHAEHDEPAGHDTEHAHGEEDTDHAEHDEAAGHDNEHGHGAANAHVWLDPANAAVMVEAIAAALAAADPANADAYGANAAATVARIDSLTAEMGATLAPVANAPFIVFHDAYQNLEHRFGLNAVGSVTVSPEVQPGAARLSEIRGKITALGAVCVFSEPQFTPALVDTVIEGTAARTGVLDPLGADIDDGPEQYFTMMRRLAAALRTCLDGPG